MPGDIAISFPAAPHHPIDRNSKKTARRDETRDAAACRIFGSVPN
jgi:hypothetical protein